MFAATIGSIVFYLVLGVLVVDAGHSFLTATGPFKERLLAIGKNSATISMARAGLIAGMSIPELIDLANVAISPEVRPFIEQVIPVKAVGWTMMVAAVIAEYSRKRTLSVPLIGAVNDDPLKQMAEGVVVGSGPPPKQMSVGTVGVEK